MRLVVLYLLAVLWLYGVDVDVPAQPKRDFTIGYFYDENGTLGIDDVRKLPFDRTLGSRFTLGYFTGGVHWFRIDITNRTENPRLLLYFTNLYARTFTCYCPHDGRYLSDEEGSRSKFGDHSYGDKNPLLELSIATGESQSVFVRVDSYFAIVGEFIIYPDYLTYVAHKKEYHLGFAYYYGAMSFVILVNMFLFLTLRLRVYGYYVGYLIFFGLFISTVNGLNNNMGLVSRTQFFHALVPLSSVFFIYFTISLLELKEHTPRLCKALKGLSVLLVVTALLINIDIRPWYMVLNNLSTLVFLILLAASVKVAYRGIKKARIYLAILIAHLISLAMMSNMYLGELPNNDINQYSFMVVSLLEFAFFTLILANKINEETSEKLRIEEMLYREKASYARKLEKEVSDRTEELKVLNHKLLKLSKTDKLTQVYNRVGLDEMLTVQWDRYRATGDRFGVILVDIDFFKKINDTFGHQTGDYALQEVARILSAALQPSDTIGRWGGEEFLIVSAFGDTDRLREAAESMRMKLEQHGFEKIGRVTGSFGIAVSGGDTRDVDDLLKRADENLYRAKETGRNRVVG